MKEKIQTLLFAILFTATVMMPDIPGAADNKAKERLAVLDLEAKHGLEQSMADALSVIVRDTLYDSGHYQVMSREDIKAVASREQLVQALGCDDGRSQCLVDFGRAIGSRFMVAGSISRLGSTYTVSLRMLDTEGKSPGVIKRVSESCKCDEDTLILTVRNVSTKLTGRPAMAAAQEAEVKTSERQNKNRKEKPGLTLEKRLVTQGSPPQSNTEKRRQEAPLTSLAAGKAEYVDPVTGMEFVRVGGGCFFMGDIFSEGESDELPVHEVCIEGFYLGKYEVTQGEYRALTGKNPSEFQNDNRLPVEQVSWIDAQDFIRVLNKKSGLTYRLPTEAEWEYAARSGGKKEKYAGGTDISAIAWYRTNSDAATHRVGQKAANGLGIYDMSGNVWEWCNDHYDNQYYQKTSRNNPPGPSSGSSRVIRGGSWNLEAKSSRTMNRYWLSPYQTGNYLGFRLLLPNL